MNFAERRRDLHISAMLDLELLDMLCGDPELEVSEWRAFRNMRAEIRTGSYKRLSLKQRAWAEDVARRITPIKASDVPKGAEVETPEVLRNLPKEPPRRIVA